ncbi:MAG: hypothetical protein ABEK59_07460 [Halobacteria archaeon]
MARKNQNRSGAINSPSTVRNSLLNYLKHEFPYDLDWVHPVSRKRYAAEDIATHLKRFKGFNPEGYKAMWILFTTSATRAFIASRMMVSTSTLRRIWDNAIDTLLLLLRHPSLDPGTIQIYDV